MYFLMVSFFGSTRFIGNNLLQCINFLSFYYVLIDVYCILMLTHSYDIVDILFIIILSAMLCVSISVSEYDTSLSSTCEDLKAFRSSCMLLISSCMIDTVISTLASSLDTLALCDMFCRFVLVYDVCCYLFILFTVRHHHHHHRPSMTVNNIIINK